MEELKDSKSWLVVDQAGLAKKLAGRGKEFVVAELIQNAWDAPGVTEVLFDCRYRNGKIHVSAQDNSPGGFADLRHSFTTVSYTHLDVYKRQARYPCEFCTGRRSGAKLHRAPW